MHYSGSGTFGTIPNEAKPESTQSSLSDGVESAAQGPAGRERSRSAAGGAVPHDAGNGPFDPIAPADRRAREMSAGWLTGFEPAISRSTIWIPPPPTIIEIATYGNRVEPLPTYCPPTPVKPTPTWPPSWAAWPELPGRLASRHRGDGQEASESMKETGGINLIHCASPR